MLKRYAPSGRVLDVGCSTGQFAAQLRDAGYDALGCDISEDACRKAAALLGEDRALCGPVESSSTGLRGSLDAITMMDVIEHFDDVVSPLRAMREMLRPGGILPAHAHAPLAVLQGGRPQLPAERRPLQGRGAQDLPRRAFLLLHRAGRALLEDTGYEVLAIDPDPLLWENFRSAEMRQGPLVNSVLAAVDCAGRLADRGHGMKVVARRPG